MPTGKLNIPWIAARITERQLDELAALVKGRSDPRRVRLEKKRGKLVVAIGKLDAEIARLTGAAGSSKVVAKSPGRRPGRPAKVAKIAAVRAKRGRRANATRPAGASAAGARKAPGTRRPKASKAKRPVADPARRAKLLENLAKARAARAAKKAGGQ